jgi:hypothetical protein
MAVAFNIQDGCDTSVKAKVTPSGELVVGPVKYDEATFNELALTGTAYNFVGPKPEEQFIITGFVAVSDKNLTADAIVDIYEADSTSSTTVDKCLTKFAITKNAVVAPTPLRILVNHGVYVNAKTDAATIYITMFGFYIDKLDHPLD